MFYGAVTSSGTIDTTIANSNNWTVSKIATGYYKIVLNQYINYKPEVTVTCNLNGAPSSSAMARSAYVGFQQDSSNRWNIYVNTVYYSSKSTSSNGSPTHSHTYYTLSAHNLPFSFRANTGMTRVFEVPDDDSTIELIPEVVEFNGTKVLALKTNYSKLQVSGAALYIDKGSELVGVGDSMGLTLSSTTVSLGDDTWDLTGWTYGGNSGQTGKQWTNGTPGSGNANYLAVNPGQGQGQGPLTTPFSFAIKGIKQDAPDSDPDKYISSDPVVRLSAVAAGGLVLS